MGIWKYRIENPIPCPVRGYGDIGIWGYGDIGIWGYRDPGFRNSRQPVKYNEIAFWNPGSAVPEFAAACKIE